MQHFVQSWSMPRLRGAMWQGVKYPACKASRSHAVEMQSADMADQGRSKQNKKLNVCIWRRLNVAASELVQQLVWWGLLRLTLMNRPNQASRINRPNIKQEQTSPEMQWNAYKQLLVFWRWRSFSFPIPLLCAQFFDADRLFVNQCLFENKRIHSKPTKQYQT